MASQPLTLNVQEPLYRQLEQRAAKTNRTVAEATIDVLTTAIPVTNELPLDLRETLASMTLFEDEALWQAARSRLCEESAVQLEELHFKRRKEGLTADEEQTAAALLREYEKTMLVRAQTAALLRQRGHDVSVLLQPS